MGHPTETAGAVIGRYHLLQKIGEGGDEQPRSDRAFRI
jgi:hypothetical protein